MVKNGSVFVCSPDGSESVTLAGIIVLAEDDPGLRKLYTDTLEAADFLVFGAPDGIKALALLSKVTPRVVVLDIMMPRLNGIEACKRARGIIGYDIPILFLSTLDRLDVLRDCIAAGGDDYMIKSDSLHTMVERVRHWSRKGGRGELAERRKQMLDDFATQLDEGGAASQPMRTADNGTAKPQGGERIDEPEEKLTSDNNEEVRAISAFVAEARVLASETFGQTVSEKLHLIGYVTGVVEHWDEAEGTLDKNFNDYLRGVLRETEVLADSEVVEMVSAFDELAKDQSFMSGREHGQRDPARRQREGDAYAPAGLASFTTPARKAAAGG